MLSEDQIHLFNICFINEKIIDIYNSIDPWNEIIKQNELSIMVKVYSMCSSAGTAKNSQVNVNDYYVTHINTRPNLNMGRKTDQKAEKPRIVEFVRHSKKIWIFQSYFIKTIAQSKDSLKIVIK